MSDDLIKREDVIEAIEDKVNGSENRLWIKEIISEIPSADLNTEFAEWAKLWFKEAPFVNRSQEWIPCSERLPKIGEKVLASTKKTVFTQVYKGIYSDPCRWVWEKNSIKEIVAWMPLPEPWKGADNE